MIPEQPPPPRLCVLTIRLINADHVNKSDTIHNLLSINKQQMEMKIVDNKERPPKNPYLQHLEYFWRMIYLRVVSFGNWVETFPIV